MKGGVAAILGAVGRAADGGTEVPPFAVHFVVGEEDGGLGAYATLARGHTGDACVIPEPTDLRLVTANAGVAHLPDRGARPGHPRQHPVRRVVGDRLLPADPSRPWPSSSAAATPIREPLLRRLPDPLPAVGRPGPRPATGPAACPDRLVAEGRYGLRIDEDPAAARAELEAAVAEAAERDPYLRDHPPRVTLARRAVPRRALPAGHPLGPRVADAHRQVTGRDARAGARRCPYGSDLRLYAGAGIPTLHYGPGSPREAHGPDESVPIEELVVAAEVLALLAYGVTNRRQMLVRTVGVEIFWTYVGPILARLAVMAATHAPRDRAGGRRPAVVSGRRRLSRYERLAADAGRGPPDGPVRPLPLDRAEA